jgi:hypothetical protein
MHYDHGWLPGKNMGGDHALFQGNSLDTLSITIKQLSHDARKIADVWNGCLQTKN